jgi:2',3'-cyclic-nucleotide 2'-phosphodiesterase (5'-nucleotidase family)
MNKGGIRRSMPKGSVSEGIINSMYPFDNRLMVLELTGEQLLRSLEIMVARGGDATSGDLRVEYTKDKKIKSAKINGKNINPKKKYNVATLDYLANGGDYMTSLVGTKRLFADNVKVSVRYLDYIAKLTKEGKVIDGEDELRMKLVE